MALSDSRLDETLVGGDDTSSLSAGVLSQPTSDPSHLVHHDGQDEHNEENEHDGRAPPEAAEIEIEVEEHVRKYMLEAQSMAELALQTDETPVGCVFVCNDEIIGRGMNDTNKSLNGTRHAELVAIEQMLKIYPLDVFKQTDLYVTVEPCIMCASALRQYGIRKVYFGCFNDRFGGTGSILNIHEGPGVDPSYEVQGGIYRKEAIMLLRRFYVQENVKAPEPKQKKTRELKTEILPLQVKSRGKVEAS